MSFRFSLATLIAAAYLFRDLSAQEARPRVEVPDRVEFNRDIRPLLYENCIKCHGSDAKSRKGNLRLDTKDGAYTEFDKGKTAVVPGSLEKSELWKRISTSDREDLMPPAKTGKKLSKPQIETFKRWIQQGADWQGHWAVIPPKKMAPPPTRNAG